MIKCTVTITLLTHHYKTLHIGLAAPLILRFTNFINKPFSIKSFLIRQAVLIDVKLIKSKLKKLQNKI